MCAMKKHREGYEFTTKQGYIARVENYIGVENIIVNFVGTDIRVKTRWQRIIERAVENPYHPTFFGVGFRGQGNYSLSLASKACSDWTGMLFRCYGRRSLPANPTYKDVYVCESWHNFQNFAEWHEQNYVLGWELDKDLFSDFLDKSYSEDTCCYLPKPLNLLLSRLGQDHENVYSDPRGKVRTYSARYSGKSLGTFKTKLEAIKVQNSYAKSAREQLLQKYIPVLSERIVDAFYRKLENEAKRKQQLIEILTKEKEDEPI